MLSGVPLVNAADLGMSPAAPGSTLASPGTTHPTSTSPPAAPAALSDPSVLPPDRRLAKITPSALA
ncbi:hypothetical protein [Egbenema bharatensis]|uniref:hypothetical protein n=1 Tax=Egbenema bharatensis TaxID=3463334 RepID=UPI003A8A0748